MSDRSISSKKGADKKFELSFPGFNSDQPFAEHSAKTIHGRGDASDIRPPEGKKGKRKDVKIQGGAWNGLPYKGRAYSFKNDDPVQMQPQLRGKANVRIFMMDDDTDMEEYSQIMQLVCDGTSKISVEEREYDKKAKTWRIFLRWVDMYYAEPAFLKEKNYVTPKTG